MRPLLVEDVITSESILGTLLQQIDLQLNASSQRLHRTDEVNTKLNIVWSVFMCNAWLLSCVMSAASGSKILRCSFSLLYTSSE